MKGCEGKAYLVRRLGVVGLNLEVPADLASAVGRELGVRGVGDRRRSAGAKHRKEDGREDLLESEHGSSGGVRGEYRERRCGCECRGLRPVKDCLERRRERSRLETVRQPRAVFIHLGYHAETQLSSACVWSCVRPALHILDHMDEPHTTCEASAWLHTGDHSRLHHEGGGRSLIAALCVPDGNSSGCWLLPTE